MVRAGYVLGAPVIGALQRGWDAFVGRGEAAVTVPVMDGPLKPNRALDMAECIAEAPGIDTLLTTPTGMQFTSGAALIGRDGVTVATFGHTITCAASGPDGTVAVGLDTAGIVLRGGAHDGRRIATAGGVPLSCLTAMVFADAETLLVAQGSAMHGAGEWRRDLLLRGRSGAVWRIDLRSGAATLIRDRLAWPFGLAMAGDGGVFVAESWRHRILHLRDRPGGGDVVLADLPAYPARLVPAASGGYWLTFATVRNQLVELILREPAYRDRMMAEVPEAYWMAPALSSGGSFKEPMQGSGLKQMGVSKPWAASRSYGLLVRCDAAMQPLRSWHSRADGRRHGIMSVCADGEDLLVAAKGPGLLLRLPGAAAERAGLAA